jgi:hypothetical protein
MDGYKPVGMILTLAGLAACCGWDSRAPQTPATHQQAGTNSLNVSADTLNEI